MENGTWLDYILVLQQIPADMITQYNVRSLIQDQIPQLELTVCPSNVSLEVYNSINHFTEYTRRALELHHFGIAKKCFALAGSLHADGDRIVKFLIENSFIYYFSSHRSQNVTDELIIKSIIPKTLYSIYKTQLLQNGN